jgi:hypothetical protein
MPDAIYWRYWSEKAAAISCLYRLRCLTSQIVIAATYITFNHRSKYRGS